MSVPQVSFLFLLSLFLCGGSALRATAADWNWYYVAPSIKPGASGTFETSHGEARVTFEKSSIKIEFDESHHPAKRIKFESFSFSKLRSKFKGEMTGFDPPEAGATVWHGQFREMKETNVAKRSGVVCFYREIVLRPGIGIPYKVSPVDSDSILPKGEMLVLVQQQTGNCANLM